MQILRTPCSYTGYDVTGVAAGTGKTTLFCTALGLLWVTYKHHVKKKKSNLRTITLHEPPSVSIKPFRCTQVTLITVISTDWFCLKYLIVQCHLTLKEPGYFDPSHSRGGGGFRPPLRSRETIDETSSVWYQWIAMTLPSSLVSKKFKTYLVWRHSDVISDVMSKTRKSPKIAKIMVFCYFFKQKLHFLAMMCVKVCLHMFLLQINQINKIKHSGSVSWKTKKTKNTICV